MTRWEERATKYNALVRRYLDLPKNRGRKNVIWKGSTSRLAKTMAKLWRWLRSRPKITTLKFPVYGEEKANA